MKKSARITLLAGLVVTTTLALTGCTAILETLSEYNDASENNAALATIGLGDCFDDTTAGAEESEEEKTEVEGVVVIPCSESHFYEIYAEKTFPDGDYPANLTTLVDEFCYPEFEKFVGISYDVSELYYSALYPSVESWEKQDDRALKCLIQQDGIRTTGSLANAAR